MTRDGKADPRGMLRALPNLRALFSLGAGVERILSDPSQVRQRALLNARRAAGANVGKVMSSVHFSNRTETRMPMCMASGAQPVMLVIMMGSSSRATRETT